MSRLLRLSNKNGPCVAGKTGQGVSSIYKDITQGEFPRPIKKGRSSFWLESEVDAVIAARVAGKSGEEIQRVVARLEAARARALEALAA